MGIKQILEDDLTGMPLPDDTKAQTVTFDGKKYEVYLSASSTEKFVDFLSGNNPIAARGSSSTAQTRTRRSTTVDTYGYPTSEVREWWSKNAVDGKKGGNRGRIPQAVYDAYKASH